MSAAWMFTDWPEKTMARSAQIFNTAWARLVARLRMAFRR